MKKLILSAFVLSACISVSPAFAHDEAMEKKADGTMCEMKEGTENIFKKTGHGLKNGMIKVKNGFVHAGHKVKGVFTKD